MGDDEKDDNHTVLDSILEIARANHPKKSRKAALVQIQQIAAKAHFMTEDTEAKFVLERIINAAGSNLKKKGRAFKDVIWEASIVERRSRYTNVGTTGHIDRSTMPPEPILEYTGTAV